MKKTIKEFPLTKAIKDAADKLWLARYFVLRSKLNDISRIKDPAKAGAAYEKLKTERDQVEADHFLRNGVFLQQNKDVLQELRKELQELKSEGIRADLVCSYSEQLEADGSVLQVFDGFMSCEDESARHRLRLIVDTLNQLVVLDDNDAQIYGVRDHAWAWYLLHRFRNRIKHNAELHWLVEDGLGRSIQILAEETRLIEKLQREEISRSVPQRTERVNDAKHFPNQLEFATQKEFADHMNVSPATVSRDWKEFSGTWFKKLASGCYVVDGDAVEYHDRKRLKRR